LLELLDRHETRATFFALGWVAERQPKLMRAIADAGHELASHGWDHRPVTAQTPSEFRDSVRRTKHLLEDLTGSAVVGFRAPNFSIVRGTEWALDVLIEEGHSYDSSLFPIRRPGYGYAAGRRDPHWIARPAGRLAELPPLTLRRAGVNLPAGGGGYLRLLPYKLVHAALADFDRRGVPATLYVHPWEIDAEQPRLPVPWWVRARHYGGLRRTYPRLERLLSKFQFTSVAARRALEEIQPFAVAGQPALRP
jgi:polysaccharide deacetylase family protein (PEP-CTERM system associated)